MTKTIKPKPKSLHNKNYCDTKKPKVIKRTPKKKNGTKDQDRLGHFIFMNTWCKERASKSFIEALCGRMLEYFTDETKLLIEEFLDSEDIAQGSYDGWIKQHDNLRQVHDHTLQRLATRREKGMLTKVISEKSGMHIQHFYSEKWSKANKYWSELRKIERDNDKTVPINVYIPKIQDNVTEQDKPINMEEYKLLDKKNK